jgi:hypothetical protein
MKKRVEVNRDNLQFSLTITVDYHSCDEFQRCLAAARQQFAPDADVSFELNEDEVILYATTPLTPESAEAYANYLASKFTSDDTRDFERSHPWHSGTQLVGGAS